MKSFCLILFYSFLLTLLNQDQVSSVLAYTLTPSQSIKDGETLTSQSETFELGFFSPSRNSKNRYLGMWYKKVPVQTVVWVANRDSPLNDSSGVLTLSAEGNLVILNKTNRSIWSTDSSKTAANPMVEFLESGNLVLRDQNSGEYLWQSFDHPSDTMLPDMKIGWDSIVGQNRHLTSWKSSDDPSLGEFTYGIDFTPYPEPVIRNGANKYYRSGPWNGLRLSGQAELNNRVIFVSQVVGNESKASFSFQLAKQYVLTRLILRQNGNHGELQRLTWVVNRSQNWLLQYSIPRDRCDEYDRCGVGSICDINEVPGCRCLEGFKPASPAHWNEMDWSRGCERKKPLDCANRDGFLKYTEVKLPDTTKTWMNMSLSLEECRVKCLKNCSCMAYANTDIRGNGSGCVMWFGDLIDIRKVLGAGQDLYIRMAASESGVDVHKESKTVPESVKTQNMIITISVVSLVLLFGTGVCFIWRWKILQKTHQNSSRRVHITKIQGPPFCQKTDDLELNLFDRDTIVRATCNFSNINMLGKGGFGCVYQGTLEDGQKIAVKRLSENSRQGVEEFKNEVTLIARLQHRNLVRLLGLCVEGDEKILVYEHMENKGLDAILFDKANNFILDWPKRFAIILGISRGLLYLHQDSRFRIIHRDLKTSNVLLDGQMNPKISDFGMARIFGGDDTQGKTERVVGTFGYMSPEYIMNGIFSVKSDVFSFGVLVLEIISGKKNTSFLSSDDQLTLLEYAWRLWKECRVLELIDKTVKDSCLPNEALRCIHIGLLCVQEQAKDRPIMSSVVLMLSSDTTKLPQPKQPGFCFDRSLIKADSTSGKQESSSANHITVTMVEAR